MTKHVFAFDILPMTIKQNYLTHTKTTFDTMLPQSTIKRIEKEADNFSRADGYDDAGALIAGYKAGATAYAERSQQLLEAIEAMLKSAKAQCLKGERVMVEKGVFQFQPNEIIRIAEQALSNYQNPQP